MKQDQLKSAYTEFFYKSEAGKYFITSINDLITKAHEHAEDNAELARDYTQEARGARQVLNHIQSVTTEIKKGKAIR